MRILLCTGIYPPDIGGPATFARGLAEALVTQAHEVTVLTYGDPNTVTRDAWPVHVIRTTTNTLANYIRYTLAVWRYGRHADVLYVSGPISDGIPVTLANVFLRKPIIMKVVGDAAWEEAMLKSGASFEPLELFVHTRHAGSVGVKERLERWTATRASFIVTPSEFLQRIVLAWGVAEDRVRVVYNAVEDVGASSLSREEARELCGVKHQRVLLTVVRAMPWKGVDFLIEIFPRLSPDTVLVVAGDGPSLSSWKHLAHERGLESRVRFLGRVDRKTISLWYACADAFVLHTGYEGFPHVVVEAGSSGLPCFVSDRGGNVETKNFFGDQIHLLPYQDADAWIKALTSLPARVPAQIPETLCIESMTQTYIDLLKGLIL